jgi:exodeoxyribonuclease VIII
VSEGYFKDLVTASDQPQNNMEAMIDIESFGTVAGSPIVTIGAVLFDPYSSDSSQAMLDRSLNIRIDLSDSIDLSVGVEGGTLRWWFEQSDQAIKALVGDDAVSIKEALAKLWRFCCERGSFVNKEFFPGLSDLPKASRYWAKDPDFDMQLMRYYYEHPDIQKGIEMPWKFWECRSVRTVQDLAWPGGSDDRPTFEVPGVAHDARWDSIQQAMTIQAAIRRLGLAKDQDVEFGRYQAPYALS